jgi:hypothetical protein
MHMVNHHALHYVQELRGQVLGGGSEGCFVLAAVDGRGHRPEAARAPAVGVRGRAADHEGQLLPAVHAGRRGDRPGATHQRVRPDAAATHRRRAGPADEDGGW